MSRRTTLGGISQSGANVRASRMSLGPSRASSAAESMKTRGRMSLAPGGRSSIGAARKSSIGATRKNSTTGGRGSTLMGRIADPRNVSDKAYMTSSIRALIEYLTQHSFDHAISPKILTRPAVKDFNNIVHFLFQQIDPNFVCTGNFGDEVISMFKYLRYPFQISKTNLVAVGSPTAWPALLATIMWLIELLKYDGEACAQYSAQDVETEVDDPASADKAFFTYLSKAYECFLGGDDNAYAQLETEFVNAFETLNDVISEQLASYEEKNRVLSEEIAEMDTRRAYLPELQAKKKDYQHDHGKFEQLIGQLIKHQATMESKKADRTAQMAKLDEQIAAAKADIAALKERVATQELSPDDVQRMTEKKEKLQEQLEAAGESKSAAARKTWEAEMQLREKIIALDASTNAYNTLAEELRLVPHTAKYARGKNMAIEIDVRAKKRTGVIKTSVTGDVLPALKHVRAEFAEIVSKAKLEEVELQDCCDDIDRRMAESEEAHGVLESRVRRAEDAFKRERDAVETAMAASEREMDEMEGRLASLRDCATEEARSSAAARRAAEARAARDARRTQHKSLKKDITQAIMEVVAQCANHREMVQTQLEDIRSAFGVKLEELLQSSEAGLGGLAQQAAAPVQAKAAAAATSRKSVTGAGARRSMNPRASLLGGSKPRMSLAVSTKPAAVEDIELNDAESV